VAKDFTRPTPSGQHCRHYDYSMGVDGGPKCAHGVDLSASLATSPCMPDSKASVACDLREEHTAEERLAWKIWRDERAARTISILALIPGSSRDKKNMPEWGKSGRFPCPCCDGGQVAWARARSNGHLHAACRTPNCFGIFE
jgi:hypothetical protein